ncbi:MAG: hypothetical protein H0V17_36340 [Deltaproteobacteria bacterium]|nr:hypothetical protein [Deltaproteobacteria bacterium]
MRLLSVVLLSLPIVACVSEDDAVDLGSVADGKTDAPAIQDVPITVAKATSSKPGVRNLTVRASVDFDVSLAYDTGNEAKLTVTNLDTGAVFESTRTTQPRVAVTAGGADHEYKIRIENHTKSTLRGTLSALGKQNVSPGLLAAARANLDRIDREIDRSHLANYGLTGSLTDQFMTALSSEYERQHPDMYEARVKALASMIFFALPDVMPPDDGKKTTFHGLDMDQFEVLARIEDDIFEALIDESGNVNGVRPFSVCETDFIIESYVRPKTAFPGFAAHRTAYGTHATSCTQKDKDDWYNFRGLGALRPSWVESNLADRFLRRMAKQCRTPSARWVDECALWEQDRVGYRQLRNRQLAARTMFYAPEDQDYLIDSDNFLVLLEDRNGDGVGEFLRPGPVTLKDGRKGILQVNSTGEFTGNLKFIDDADSTKTPRSVTPEQVIAVDAVDPAWQAALIHDPDLGMSTVFADPTACTGPTIDEKQCPLMQRFFSMIDRHENFYRTYSALSPDFAGISSQPSPLVACSITLEAAHGWDTAGTPSGGEAGFIFLMRIPFQDILTGNDRSVATLMPGPKTTSIQSLFSGGKLDFESLWLDVASLSNNQFESEHEISAFGAVKAEQIEGILVIRKPAALP